MTEIRHNWTKEEIAKIYYLPIMELIYQASVVHRKYQVTGEVQVCTLLSIKTGGCPEDCAYCPQAARYHTNVEAHKLLEYDEVITKALIAKENGATRFCMGAAWRNIRDNKDFDNVLTMVKGVANLELEVCCTLGMLTEEHAKKLKDAGLYAYNHNLDSGEEFYEEIISTRKYEDRLNTINHVQNADISVCSGGIIGMGENDDDRIGLLYTLSTLKKHPESVPVNALVAVKGTPLENMKRVSVWEMIRMIATARIIFPKAMVRLSAGRNEMSIEEQALCFMAGANSIFAGEKLLTTPNPEFDDDKKMFEILGLRPRKVYKKADVTISQLAD
ncbi:MAG: biotin synthase BioB [Fimbriimonadaceae bacterium]|nr:biotin synthase BioB [Chitinophagales bacterium]